MPLRVLFVIGLLVGIVVSVALRKLHRSRLEHMMLGGLCVLTGGVLSLNPHISNTSSASLIAVGLVYFGFVLGVLGFYFNKQNS